MEEKYKYVFFKYIYDKLNLEYYEKDLQKYDINPIEQDIEGLYKDISRYFSLLNNVNDKNLTEEQRKKYNYYFSLPIEKILDKSLENEINVFLEETYEKMLFPDIKEDHYYYGPLNNKYLVPKDSVALGFNYCEFDIEDENFSEKHLYKERVICRLLNNIKLILAKQIGMKISTIRYNEYSFKKVRR